MKRISPIIVLLAAAWVLPWDCLSERAVGQQDEGGSPQPLRPLDHRACVFANSTQVFLYSLTESVANAGQVNWLVRWSLASGSRTVSRGSARAMTTGADVPTYSVEVPVPPVSEGVVVTLTLKMVWSDGDRQYRHSRPLHVFSRDPLAGQKFLQEANISLFDPESKTSDLFERHGIPCRLLPNLASVDSVEGGVLVVGEGISFDSQRMLAESLLLPHTVGCLFSVLRRSKASTGWSLKRTARFSDRIGWSCSDAEWSASTTSVSTNS